jgi:hypothetical protein
MDYETVPYVIVEAGIGLLSLNRPRRPCPPGNQWTGVRFRALASSFAVVFSESGTLKSETSCIPQNVIVFCNRSSGNKA